MAAFQPQQGAGAPAYPRSAKWGMAADTTYFADRDLGSRAGSGC
jgi:hypothetical protein